MPLYNSPKEDFLYIHKVNLDFPVKKSCIESFLLYNTPVKCEGKSFETRVVEK